VKREVNFVETYPPPSRLDHPHFYNALLSFKSWLSILWLSLYFGPQCRKFTRIMTLLVRTITINIASNHGLQSPGYFWFRASSASISIQERFLAPWIQFYAYAYTQCPKFGGNILVRIPYVKYKGKSTVGNTRWPGNRIKRALPRNFPFLRYEVCTDGRIGCLTMNWASTW
jgi:hypothetical protein